MSDDRDVMCPVRYRVVRRYAETADSATLLLEPVAERVPPGQPGQFSMLYAWGVGEVPISISGGLAAENGALVHTIRAVGAVSGALCAAEPGTVLGVRGPFGAGWDLSSAVGRDLVIVAGGVGLAPLRPVVLAALADRGAYGRIRLIAGARRPGEFLFSAELNRWAARTDIDVELTIDAPAVGWSGSIGFVTEPLSRVPLDPGRTTAFLCGPEPMMRFCANTLLTRGMAATDIRLSLERDMRCGVGLCGHCQLGPMLVCRDGPVVNYHVAAPLLAVREL